MRLSLNDYSIDLTLHAVRHGHWVELALCASGEVATASYDGLAATLQLQHVSDDRVDFTLSCQSPWSTRLRLRATVPEISEPFHLIPGNIHGDNNASLVRPGELPCLTQPHPSYRNRAPLWEMRADRSSHPVSILCGTQGSVGLFVEPYSGCAEADDGYIHNGVLAELPNTIGVSLGYGNDPLSFNDKTFFIAATSDCFREARTSGSIYAFRGRGRGDAHRIIRAVYERTREKPTHEKSPKEAVRALADAFIEVNWSDEVQQYTNRKCQVGVDNTLRPWRAIVEIGWTGGSAMAYPFVLAQRVCPDLRFPKAGKQILDEICDGYNERSGFINDTTINRSTKNTPDGWNTSTINGWWSGFIDVTRDAHCAYTQGHAAYYLLRTALESERRARWIETAKKVLDSAIALQRDDGAFGYVFSATERKVVSFDGFAGCWFTAALPLMYTLTNDRRYLDAAERSIRYYHPFVRQLAAWGSPMDTCFSVDSEGNLAFIRAARLLHEITPSDQHLVMLRDGAHYEYLWRYGFRTRPQAKPLRNSHWNSCGGSITSVSNPHMHPMSVIASDDLAYLARVSGDDYHARRSEDGLAWMLNTMELYPHVTGYGRYGVLSERTCPSDGLLSERYADGTPASTWWSYNAWAGAVAMEALAEHVLFNEGRSLSSNPGSARRAAL